MVHSTRITNTDFTMRPRRHLIFIIQVLIPALFALSVAHATDSDCRSTCSCDQQPPVVSACACVTGQVEHKAPGNAPSSHPTQTPCDDTAQCPEVAVQNDLTDLRAPLTPDTSISTPCDSGSQLPPTGAVKIERAPPFTPLPPSATLYILNCSFLI